jgi:AraC-like DNA-binding protein
MGALLSTTGLPERQRFAFWQDAVCDTFVELDCERLSDRAFSGEIARVEAGSAGFSVVRSQEHRVVRTPARIRRAREEAVLVSLQLSGSAAIVQDGREARLAPGDFALYDSTRPYSLSLLGDFEMLVLQVERQRLMRWLGRTEPLTARALSAATPTGAIASSFLASVAATVGRMERQTAERMSDIALALIATAFGEAANAAAPLGHSRVALLYRAKALIDAEIHDPGLNTSVIAARLGIAPRTLQDLFHAEETTVSDWIWRRRLEKARRDLADPALAGETVTQIALACGFRDMAHFSRRFRREFGRAPREVREASPSPRSP